MHSRRKRYVLSRRLGSSSVPGADRCARLAIKNRPSRVPSMSPRQSRRRAHSDGKRSSPSRIGAGHFKEGPSRLGRFASRLRANVNFKRTKANCRRPIKSASIIIVLMPGVRVNNFGRCYIPQMSWCGVCCFRRTNAEMFGRSIVCIRAALIAVFPLHWERAGRCALCSWTISRAYRGRFISRHRSAIVVQGNMQLPQLQCR